jgi:uncharacterized membrane protein YdbT with pleckstrin-like domain
MSFTKKQLLPGEQVIILARQHPVILIRPILLNLACAAVLVGLTYTYPRYAWMLLFILIPLSILLWEILVRKNREFVITDRRVVRNEGVFSVSSFDAPLDKINNVFHEQSLLGRIFRYGKVGLETASEQGTTNFDLMPNPVEFKNAIVRQRELSRPATMQTISANGRDVPRLLEELAALRDRNVITAAEFEQKKKALLDKIH